MLAVRCFVVGGAKAARARDTMKAARRFEVLMVIIFSMRGYMKSAHGGPGPHRRFIAGLCRDERHILPA